MEVQEKQEDEEDVVRAMMGRGEHPAADVDVMDVIKWYSGMRQNGDGIKG